MNNEEEIKKEPETPKTEIPSDTQIPAAAPSENVQLAATIPEADMLDPETTKPTETEVTESEVIDARSNLPSEVLAAQKLDRDSYRKSQNLQANNPQSEAGVKPIVQMASSTVSNVTSEPKKDSANGKPFEKLKLRIKEIFKKESNLIKILIIIPAVIIGIFLLMVLAYLFNFDTAIFKITMHGSVKDGLTQQPVSFAKIYINDKEEATSDNSGNYQISNLNPQISEVKIQANGYDEYKKQTVISRGFLAYTIRQDFVLTSSIKATITGKLIANDAKYNFLNDKLLLNDKEYTIKTDGTFEATDISTGTLHMQFTSISFKDIDKTFNIKAGNNKLQDTVLEPAGDITGELKSYVSEDLVLGTQFNIENVTENQVKTDKDGNFVIKDLDVDKKYKIKVIATGYNTRDYEIDIKQGENKLFDFRLVEDFTASFIRKSSSKNQLFVSDLDGVNSAQVTFIDNFSPTGWYMSNEENKLYFLSNHEKIKGLITSLRLAYSIDTVTNLQTKLTTNTANLANIYSNFRAKKLINVIEASQGNNNKSQKLQVTDLAGSNVKDIKTINQAEFTSTFLSDSGNYVFFYENDGNATGFYRVDVNSAESKTISQVANVQPYDASQNGEKTIFSRKNSSTGFNDLALYTFATNETRILDENLDGFDYQFIKGSSDEILYFATRAGKANIYKFTISQNKDEKVTSLAGDDVIKDIYQSGNFLFYYTNKGLYVLDIAKPKNFKLVTNDVVLPN